MKLLVSPNFLARDHKLRLGSHRPTWPWLDVLTQPRHFNEGSSFAKLPQSGHSPAHFLLWDHVFQDSESATT